MKRKIKIDINCFETMGETSENKLVGGFSTSFTFQGTSLNEEGSNNCQGGNCASGCGNGQNVNCKGS